ncbi:hypothetical protein DFJ43DRAFT_1151620 [Lentinula guzmanii]|uniref:Fungal-type protein kinase domain-containing protein n=1 Tax=Lentinula guzmanii TaxID=2804957 RepID=A0AA38JDI2_9AGAR|nr:hypothetical protein DFJ43DRAFT_1151620 [Lentinula guzmanii]
MAESDENSHDSVDRPHMTALLYYLQSSLASHSDSSTKSKRVRCQLDCRRETVIADLGNMVPEVDLDWFFENLLPPLPKGIDISTVIKQLQELGAITEDGWAGFSCDPKAERRHEDIVFAQLGPVFQAILDAVKELHPSLQQTFTLLFQPTRLPLSERGRSTKPDNCWVSVEDFENIMKDPTRFYTWYTIAGPAEDKRLAESSREQRNKNVAQIIYNLQQIMSLDPCRRFTFGTTMQNRQMRVWFACRGVVLTTKACDFLKDRHRLVHLFISFAFSSRQDFGWDPTIICIDPEFSPPDRRKRRVYEIEVRNDTGEVKFYKTVRILADYAADSTVSRATRVWLVEDDKGDQYVLKDVWLDMDRLPEHEIRTQLLDDVLKECGPDDQATLKRHLLTPHICGKVFVDGVIDTTDGMMRKEVLQLSHASVFTLKLESIANPLRQSCDPASASVVTHSHSNRKSQTKPPMAILQQTLSFRHKYHYRIVFAEHGHTLFEEKSLLNVYIILTDLLTAVESTEILAVGTFIPMTKTILAASLETLNMREDGTLDFMASEVISQSWDYLPIPPEDDDEDDIQPAPFAYNPLHDLESCWWLLVYILFHNEDASNVLSDPNCISQRRNLINSLFTRRPDTTWRSKFMRNYKAISIKHTSLSPSLTPTVRTISLMANRLIRAFALYLGYDTEYVLEGKGVR